MSQLRLEMQERIFFKEEDFIIMILNLMIKIKVKSTKILIKKVNSLKMIQL